MNGNPSDGLLKSYNCDTYSDVFFVANIDGDPSSKDGNGFIAKVSTDGEVKKLKWVEELNAPKGMGIYNDVLYVTDIDEVVAISISDSKIKDTYPIDGASFLNDIDIDKQGDVFISDSRTNKIHKLSNGQVTTFVELNEEGTNGLFVDGDKLLVGVSGKIMAIDLKTKGMSNHILDTGGGVDGLEKTSADTYVISDWQGKTHLIAPGKDRILLLDTTDDKVNAADLEFVPEKNMVVIPTFFDNRITAYELTDD